MSRLPRLEPAALSTEQEVVYRAITTGPRSNGPQLFRLVDAAGTLEGPFNLMLYSPAVGAALQQVGSAVRFQTVLSDRSRELAILAVAAELGSEFELYAHARLATAAGVPRELIAHIHSRVAANETGEAVDRPDGISDEDDVVLGLVGRMLARTGVDADTYRHAVSVLGERGVVELVVLVGYYWTLASAMSVFDVGLPEGEELTW